MNKTIDTVLGMPIDPKMRGLILKKRREDLGLSQNAVAQQLAQRLDVDKFDYKRISDWETGRIKNIPEQIKIHLYLILNINEAEDLFLLKEKAKNRQKDIYEQLAQEFKNYVSSEVKHNQRLADQKEYTVEVAYNFNKMVQDFLRLQDSKLKK